MAKQIRSLDFHLLRNAELLHILMRLVTAFNPITLARIIPLALAFKAAVEAFDALMRQIAGTVETRDMKSPARDRAVLLTDLFRAVDRGLHNTTDLTILSAANRIDLITRAYHDAGKKPQDEQTQLITELIKDLTSPDMKHCLPLLPSAATAVAQLDTANKEFERLYNERTRDAGKHDIGGTLRTRTEAETACRKVIRVINSSADYLEDGSLDTPIDAANAILTDAQHIINRLKGHRHENGLNVEVIPGEVNS